MESKLSALNLALVPTRMDLDCVAKLTQYTYLPLANLPSVSGLLLSYMVNESSFSDLSQCLGLACASIAHQAIGHRCKSPT